MEKEQAKERIRELVEKFESYSKSDLDFMSEDQIKTWFIEPLFFALGWDTYDLFKEERIIELVERIIQFHKEGKSEQDIANVDYEIDQEVYKLYGITEEEKKIISESCK